MLLPGVKMKSMEMSAGLFAQIQDDLRGESRYDRDKRDTPRVGVRHKVMLYPIVGGFPGEPRLVRIRDMSANGIGLVADEPLATAATFFIRLIDGKRPALTITYRVCYCTLFGPKLYSIGAMLISQSDGLRVQRKGALIPKIRPL